jgi:recombination protein RecT
MELRHEGHTEVDAQSAATLADHLQTDTFQRHLEAVLPAHMSSERFASVCLRQLSTTPRLQECSLRSVIGGMMEAAVLGLEIGTQGECWLIPYNDRDAGLQAQLQVGVWGHMALAWRSTMIADVQIDVVLPGDRFSFRKGTDAYLHHEPQKGRDLGEAERAIEWVYAVIRTKGGGTIFDAFDAAWIERIRGRSKSPNSPAWSNFYAEQAQAKCLKKVLKVCPKSREMARAITLDDEADAGAKQVWTVDTSLLLAAEQATDPKVQEAREEMAKMGEKPSREPATAKRGNGPASPARQSQAKRAEPPPHDDADAPPAGGTGWDD